MISQRLIRIKIKTQRSAKMKKDVKLLEIEFEQHETEKHFETKEVYKDSEYKVICSS